MKVKTSVYLEPEQTRRLKRAAEAAGRAEADIIREGIELALLRNHAVRRTRPWPSFDSGDPLFATGSKKLLDEAYGE